jgi:hypothetical protein
MVRKGSIFIVKSCLNIACEYLVEKTINIEILRYNP